jgi:hypothetical protein
MGAITGIILKDHFPLGTGGSVPGGLYCEIWQVPAETAGDTQTITPIYVVPKYVVGPVSHTAITYPTDTTVAFITSVTIAASNFCEVLVIGTLKASGPA